MLLCSLTNFLNFVLVCYTPTTSVATRPIAVVASQSIPIAKIFPQNSGTPTTSAENEIISSQGLQAQSSNMYIQAAHRTLSSPGEFSLKNRILKIFFFE